MRLSLCRPLATGESGLHPCEPPSVATRPPVRRSGCPPALPYPPHRRGYSTTVLGTLATRSRLVGLPGTRVGPHRGPEGVRARLITIEHAQLGQPTSAANRPTHPLSFHSPIDLRLDDLLDHPAAHLAYRRASLPLLRRVQLRRMTIQIPTNLFTDLTPLARATQGKSPR